MHKAHSGCGLIGALFGEEWRIMLPSDSRRAEAGLSDSLLEQFGDVMADRFALAVGVGSEKEGR